jgi:RNA polymerase sigma-70 factor (ECF subfamily)
MKLRGLTSRERAMTLPSASSFEQVVLPHLDAAYNLARWLTGRDHDAEDVVQEATLRAVNAFAGFHGGDARCWFLAVVRSTCYTWLQRNRRPHGPATLSFELLEHEGASDDANPEVILQRRADRDTVRLAVEELPIEYREALILREFEGLSYQEIAAVAGVPVGTVMSRLSRARKRLGRTLGAGGNPAADAAPRGAAESGGVR